MTTRRAGHHRALLSAAAVAIAAAGVAGCQGVTASGTPYTLKINREVEAYVSADLPTTHSTSRDVLEQDYLYVLEYDALDADVGVLQARTAENHLVQVKTHRVGEDVTRVSVFVSPFGQQGPELEIFTAIEQRINELNAVK